MSRQSHLLIRNGLIYGLTSFVMVMSFQNCDGGFKTGTNAGSNSSSGATDQFRMTTFSPTGEALSEGQGLDGGVEYRLESAGAVLPVTVTWTMPLNTGGCTLRAGPGTAIRYLTCTSGGRVQVRTAAYWPDGSSTVLLTDRPTSTYVSDSCGVNMTSRRVFRIPNGTGTAAWNSSVSPVIVYVGQTLRVCNDDATKTHQFRTAGSPCASQPSPMAKSEYYDCAVANSSGLAGDGTFTGLYDNTVGASAAFYVKPYNGQILYSDTTKSSDGKSCVSCHGAFSNSEKRGGSYTGLKDSIAANKGGMGVFQGRFTDDELRAIAFSLNQ